MLPLDYNIIENNLCLLIKYRTYTIMRVFINFITIEIGLKLKHIVLAKDDIYLYGVYLLTIISSF